MRLRGMDIERPGRSGASSSGFDIGSGAQGFGVCDEGQSQSEWGQKCGRGTNIRSVRKSRVLVQESEGCARLRVCDEGLEQLLGARVGDGKGFRVQGPRLSLRTGGIIPRTPKTDENRPPSSEAIVTATHARSPT